MADVSTIRIVVESDQANNTIDGVERNLNQMTDGVRRAEVSLNSFGASSGKMFAGLKTAAGAAAVAFAALGLAAVGKAIVQTNASFQSLEASLITATGSAEKARAAMDALQILAEKTPFSLEEATQGFIALKNMGLDPSERALIAYGNTASSMGKSLDAMIQSVTDATQGGGFERLKEFGIRMSAEGDTVKATFAGVTETIGNNARDIENYLIRIGETKFAGAMERQANTITGVLSNLSDRMAGLSKSFGEGGFNDAFVNAVRKVSDALVKLKPIMEDLGRWAGDAINRVIADFERLSSWLSTDSLDIGGILASPGEAMLAGFDTAMDGITSLFEWQRTYFQNWVSSIGELFGLLSDTTGSVWQGMGDEGRFATLLITSAFADMISYIVKGISAVPGIFVGTLKTVVSAVREYGTAIAKFFANGFDASVFDGLFDRIDTSMIDRTKELWSSYKTIYEETEKDIKEAWGSIGTESGVELNNKFFRALDAAREKYQQRLKERTAPGTTKPAPGGNGDPLGGGNRPPPSIFEQAGTSADAFGKSLERLRGQYTPAIDRAMELADTMKVLELAQKLGNDGLKQYGLTLTDVAAMSERANKRLGSQSSFFSQTMRDLKETIERPAGNGIENAVADQMADILARSEAVNEELTKGEQLFIAINLNLAERIKRENELKEVVKQRSGYIEDEISLMGVYGRQAERIQELLSVRRQGIELGLSEGAIQKQVSAMDEWLNKLDEAREAQNTFGNGARRALTEYSEAAQDIASITYDAVSNIMSSTTDILAQQMEEGHFRLKDYLKVISQELNRFAAQQITGNFAALLNGAFGGAASGGSSLVSSIIDGFREEGGPVRAGGAYVVGEKRPELFVPSTSGYILPSVPTGNGGGSTSVALTMDIKIDSITTSSGGNPEEEKRELVAALLSSVKTMIADEKQFNGINSVRR